MPALVLSRSSRDMPGLRAMPAVMTTTSEPAVSSYPLVPITRVSYSSIGADCHWSSPLPCGIPSAMSTRTTTFASSFSAMRCAVVAPTFPAPTTVILLTIDARDVMGELRQRAEVIGGGWEESIGGQAGNREWAMGTCHACRATRPHRQFPHSTFPVLPPHLAQRPQPAHLHLQQLVRERLLGERAP